MFSLNKRLKRDFLDSCARIRWGSLTITTPEGDVHTFGTGEPHAEVEIHDWSVVAAMAARGDIGMGECYVAGMWDTPSIETFTTVALRNMDHLQSYAFPNFWSNLKFRAIDRVMRANSIRGSSRNIRSHYDVGNEFYQLWLDPGMTYSSGIYAQDDSDLGRAQDRKYDRILNRLGDGERVLEIGCGWGGFAERAADQGRAVTGVTISPSQKGYADARLDGRADIQLRDYRKTDGTFDHIVSIEMIEAVGEKYWPTYFATLKSRLSEGGRAMVQAITVPDANFDIYRNCSDFIRQYTFPGGMLLSDAMISWHARAAGLKVKDNFAFGQDYALTCRQWAERLEARQSRINALGFDQNFLRTWRYYLGMCAGTFAAGNANVVQVELAHA